MACGCGRSPTGKCIGWHALSEKEYQEKLKQYKEKELAKKNGWISNRGSKMSKKYVENRLRKKQERLKEKQKEKELAKELAKEKTNEETIWRKLWS